MSPQRKAKNTKKLAYFNRELSWLAFNRRVLDLAQSEQQPLLERVKFLSIVSSNLDEFFEIRVAGLTQQVESGVVEVGIDGLGPKEQLRRIHAISSSLVKDQYKCWREQIMPLLKRQGIVFKNRQELSRREFAWARKYFDEQVYPVLTPMGIDPSHPFPQLINKSLNILVKLAEPGRGNRETRVAVIPVPRILPRVVHIDLGFETDQSYIFLSDLIKMFDEKLFPGYKMKGAWAFRITRNSDLYIDEEEVENLLTKIEEELNKKRKGDPVRLEIEHDVEEEILDSLLSANQIPSDYVFRIDGPINQMRLMSVYSMIERQDLKDKPLQAFVPAQLSASSDIFENIRARDHLLHHPFDSFNPVVDFLNQAARDPKVFAIKQTLYRTSGDSPIIEALKLACQNGKQVTALVELKARFDEANNIQWARELEEVGVHVVYGLVHLKTHCKCCLIVRREGKGLRRYAHLGTGNYNPKTAKIYTDLSLFTAHQKLTSEIADLFNTLTGFSRSPQFKHLLIAPFNLHSEIQKRIRREVRNAKAGKPARIIAKCNSLIEKETINNLYTASRAGVEIDLIIRGICSLVPGVAGMSENIRVRSLVGRFLEHSRIFYFENGDHEPEVFIGSADWMARNFFRRIECVFPILDPELKARLIKEIIPPYLKDTNAKVLKSNGAYSSIRRTKPEDEFSCQQYFLENQLGGTPAPNETSTVTPDIRQSL
ncbi:polyphosphate kinase 1 [Cerasicoccus arenae]|uniref:Polyphosphate kinase n=1 Tax=Cerasicoccus arenae TaxID=424488 RepID=A0A8J3GE25_9BACT|nr:polyphosphate kinase 1 [Cerasicoccus arenae]MBK1858557.1 polyphosphate kinase 1 [Cerasicoccus arenae]GHC06282.1 polyphosphate kinase [Cerasicoccus arenae]